VGSHHIALNGEIGGKWMVLPTANPDAGVTQSLTGSGTVGPLGNVQAKGILHGTGFIATGRSTGTLTLSNAQGSVTLLLTGSPQPGFGGISRHYTFKIIASTGAFKGDQAEGAATLTEVMADGIAPKPGKGHLPIIVGPIFGLTLVSATVV
jgi:hypothetical protein